MHHKCSVLLASALLVLVFASSSHAAHYDSGEQPDTVAETLAANAMASAASAGPIVAAAAAGITAAVETTSRSSGDTVEVVEVQSVQQPMASVTPVSVKPALMRKKRATRKAAKAAAKAASRAATISTARVVDMEDTNTRGGGTTTASYIRPARRYSPDYVRSDAATQSRWARGDDGKYRMQPARDSSDGESSPDSGESSSSNGASEAQTEQQQQAGAQSDSSLSPKPRKYPLSRYGRKQQQQPPPGAAPEQQQQQQQRPPALHSRTPAPERQHGSETEAPPPSRAQHEETEDDEEDAAAPKSVGQIRDASAELHIIYSGEEGEEPSPADLDGGLIWSVSADSGSNSLGQLQPDGPYGPWHVQATQIYKWARVSGMRPFLSISGRVDAPTAVRINGRLGGIVPSSKHQTQLTSTASLASGGRVPRAFSEHTQVRLPQPEHCMYKWINRETQRTVECRGKLAASPELEFNGMFLELLDAGLHQDLEFMSRVQVSCKIEHCRSTANQHYQA